MSYTLDFREFTTYCSMIRVPAKGVWCRASSQWVSGLPDYPLFLSMKYVADFYAADPSRTMEYYENPEELRLLDVRFLQMILPYLFMNRTEPINPATKRWYEILCATFGGCSAAKQLQLLKTFANGQQHDPITRLEAFLVAHASQAHSRASPVEAMGFRVGIVDLDYRVLEVLRTVFHQIDGLIAPDLFTPAHNQGKENNLLPELILFHPQRSLRPAAEPDWNKVPFIKLEELIKPTCDMVFAPARFEHQVLVKGGSYGDDYGDALALWNERERTRPKKKHSPSPTALKTIDTIFKSNPVFHEFIIDPHRCRYK